MENVDIKVTGDTLVLTVDLKKRLGPSGSGKTTVIATTRGNVKLNGKHTSVSFGLNVYTKEPPT
jgi:ABC-type Fe3+/spermidine/putrescine transport system ATPase subunit